MKYQKSEPLVKKEKLLHGEFQRNCEDSYRVFHYVDVKLAVEWLKQQIKSNYEFDIDVYGLFRYVDEAFADVTDSQFKSSKKED